MLTLNGFSKQVFFQKKKIDKHLRISSRNKMLQLLKQNVSRDQTKIVTKAISDKKNTVSFTFIHPFTFLLTLSLIRKPEVN